MPNELPIGSRRTGDLIDFDPSTPEVKVTLERTEAGISLTVPWSDPTSPYARWFLDGSVTFNDEKLEPTAVPARLLFHDSHGAVLRRRRINVTVNAVEVADRIEVGTPKTHKRRSVPFPALLGPALAQQCTGKTGEQLVFEAEDGGYLRRTRTDESSRGSFSQAVRRAGIPRMTPHDLRHTAASLAIQSGANVKAVQRMLGHASGAMTLDVDADLFDDDLDLVAVRLNDGLARTSVGKRLSPATREPPRSASGCRSRGFVTRGGGGI